MKKNILFMFIALATTALAARPITTAEGAPPIRSMGSLAFASDGTLFVGDANQAVVYAININDKTETKNKDKLNIADIDLKLAAMLGTTPRELRIHDLAVNPRSHNVYLSVNRGRGDQAIPVLMKVTVTGQIEEVALEGLAFTQKKIPNPVAKDAMRRGRPLRGQAITDLAFSGGRLLVAGLSNEEFSSTLFSFAYPFSEDEAATSLEIFHAAHGRYETQSPIRTLLPYDLNGEAHLLAAYTCTPMVTFPMEKMKQGAHIKGKTVAELGSGNRPLDLISFRNENKDFILVANSNRTLMKIDPLEIAAMDTGLSEPTKKRYVTAGVGYVAIAQVGVQQIDNLNESYVIALQRMSNGSLSLRSLQKNRL